MDDLRRKVWAQIKSLLLKRAVLRQKTGFYSDGAGARVAGLNVTGSSGDENVTKPNGIHSG